MRMGILGGHTSVRGPASVADAGIPLHGIPSHLVHKL